tara:strand:- start:1758 stop:2081 length:324 start_codon:yes stop_codon:yes gene_type:complete
MGNNCQIDLLPNQLDFITRKSFLFWLSVSLRRLLPRVTSQAESFSGVTFTTVHMIPHTMRNHLHTSQEDAIQATRLAAHCIGIRSLSHVYHSQGMEHASSLVVQNVF